MADAHVRAAAEAEVLAGLEHLDVRKRPADERGGVVRRAVVDDHGAKARVVERRERPEAGLGVAGPVQVQDDDVDERIRDRDRGRHRPGHRAAIGAPEEAEQHERGEDHPERGAVHAPGAHERQSGYDADGRRPEVRGEQGSCEPPRAERRREDVGRVGDDVVDGEEAHRVDVAGVGRAVERLEDRPGEDRDERAVREHEREGREVGEPQRRAQSFLAVALARRGEPDRQHGGDEEEERVQRPEHRLRGLESCGRRGIQDDGGQVEEELGREPRGRDRRAEPLAEAPVLAQERPLDPPVQAPPDRPAAQERRDPRGERDGEDGGGAGCPAGRDERQDERDLAAVADDVDRERRPHARLRVEHAARELLELPGDERRNEREQQVGRRAAGGPDGQRPDERDRGGDAREDRLARGRGDRVAAVGLPGLRLAEHVVRLGDEPGLEPVHEEERRVREDEGAELGRLERAGEDDDGREVRGRHERLVAERPGVFPEQARRLAWDGLQKAPLPLTTAESVSAIRWRSRRSERFSMYSRSTASRSSNVSRPRP